MSNAIQINIKRQLAEKNLTAAELERRTGIPHAVVNIIHGRSKNPSLRTAQAIARELDCSVEDLFGERTAPKTPNATWDAQLYKAVSDAVLEQITSSKLTPAPHAVSECIAEVYLYTKDSPNMEVDSRFVQWLVTKNIRSHDNTD